MEIYDTAIKDAERDFKVAKVKAKYGFIGDSVDASKEAAQRNIAHRGTKYSDIDAARSDYETAVEALATDRDVAIRNAVFTAMTAQANTSVHPVNRGVQEIAGPSAVSYALMQSIRAIDRASASFDARERRTSVRRSEITDSED